MSNLGGPVGRYYDGWQIYNARIIEVVGQLSIENLAVRPSPDGWPIGRRSGTPPGQGCTGFVVFLGSQGWSRRRSRM